MEELEKLGGALERNVDVLDHRLGMHTGEPVQRARDAVPAVPAHDLLVGDRVQPLAPVQPPQQRVLCADVLRAPEPVGVPPPQVIVHAHEIAGAIADRAVIDLLEGVVAQVRGCLDEGPAHDVELARREHHAVEKRGVARGGDRRDVGEARRRIGIALMLDMDIRFDRHRPLRDLERVAQRPVRIGEAVEEVAMRVVARAGEDPPVAGEHFERGDGVVDEAVPERRRFDAHTGKRTAERDRLQLRHDLRHEVLCERRVGKIREGRHALR